MCFQAEKKTRHLNNGLFGNDNPIEKVLFGPNGLFENLDQLIRKLYNQIPVSNRFNNFNTQHF